MKSGFPGRKEKHIMEELPLVIITELKGIGERYKVKGSYKSDYEMGKLDAYVNVLSALHFSRQAILKMYLDYGIDYSDRLKESIN